MSDLLPPRPVRGGDSGNNSGGDGRFDAMWDELAPIGRHGGTGGYRRYAWTRTDAELREWFAAQAAARGLTLVLDRAGNQWAWRGDPDADGPGIVVGSHLDSVPDGGAYDGPLGVVSAFAALDTLPPSTKPIAVVNFGDEEGARFGVACAGSRIVTGALDADRARGLRDADGITMAEAAPGSGSFGRDDETLRRIGTFVELHVEQGRALVDRDAAVGVASAIRPHGRWRIELPGEANHAGTTALADRRDAMVSLAHVVLAARAAAEQHGGVATIGRVRVSPNGVNAIASHVTASLGARAPENAQVRAIVAELADTVDRHGGEVVEESWTESTPFPAGLAGRLATLLDVPILDTGAGHDAGILAQAGIETAMIFVRNPTGVSHSPAEHAERADCHAGVDALAAVIGELA